MRTVHGIDYDTPSDPIPRNHSSAPSKTQRLKLYVKSKPPQNNGRGGGSGDAEVDDDATICTGTDVDADPLPALPFDYPPDLGFTKEELAMRPDQLFRLVRRQLHWTEEENKALCEEVKMLIIKRKKEWQAKELILANMMEAELATAVHHGVDIGQVINLKDDLPYPMLPMSGPTPWYRIVDSEARDEAPDGGNGGDRASATQES